MKLVILNGNTDASNVMLDRRVEKLHTALIHRGHTVNTIVLRDKLIKDCIGCMACWVKTPGLCIHKDDMMPILAEIVNSDAQILVSETCFGMLGPTLKSFVDRMLPLECSYLKLSQDKTMTTHYKRYTKGLNAAIYIDTCQFDTKLIIKDISVSIAHDNQDAYIGTYVVGKGEEALLHAFDSHQRIS